MYVWVESEWLKCTHTWVTVLFFCETILIFMLRSIESKSSLVYIIFRTPTQSSWSHLPLTRCTWICLLFSMPPMQLMSYFRWSIVLFTLGNRCTSYPVMPAVQLMWHVKGIFPVNIQYTYDSMSQTYKSSFNTHILSYRSYVKDPILIQMTFSTTHKSFLYISSLCILLVFHVIFVFILLSLLEQENLANSSRMILAFYLVGTY